MIVASVRAARVIASVESQKPIAQRKKCCSATNVENGNTNPRY